MSTYRPLHAGLLLVSVALLLATPAAALSVLALVALTGLDAWLSRSEEKYGERLKTLETLTERVEKVEKQAQEDHMLLVKVSNRAPGR